IRIKPIYFRKIFSDYLGRELSNPSFYTWCTDIGKLFDLPDKREYSLLFVKLMCGAAVVRRNDLKIVHRNAVRHDKEKIKQAAERITDSEIFTKITQMMTEQESGEAAYVGKDFAKLVRVMHGIQCHINSFYNWSNSNPELPKFDRKRVYSQEEFDQWVEFLKNKPGRKLFSGVVN
ncbi:MAG: hypothetical protein ACRDBG_28315, partial [Waterburya sp.]